MKPQTTKEDKISVLLKEYFDIDNKFLSMAIWLKFKERDCLTNESERDAECIELAKFIKFIKLCGGENNQYLIQSTNKGISEKINISGDLLKLLLLSAERELSYKLAYGRGEFSGNHGANVIYEENSSDEVMSKMFANLRENYHKLSKHRYNLEELNNIIEEINKDNSGYYDFRRTEELGWISINILYELNHYGINQTEHTQRKLNSFVYDTLVIEEVESDMGKGFIGDIGKGKSEKIRDYIKAYKKRYKRLEEMRFRNGIKIDYSFIP